MTWYSILIICHFVSTVSRDMNLSSAHALAASLSEMIRPRTFMITGATDGIGKHTAQRLASDGHALLIHGRKSIENKVPVSIVEDLKERGAAKVAYLQADLNDLQQVSLLADMAVDVLRDWQHLEQNSKDIPALDVLINNAGVFDPEPRHSVQGYDSTMAVNVLAPFVLTRKLLPALVHGNEARIITTSSISQSWQLPDLDSLFARKLSGKDSYDNKPLSYSAHSSYSHSKLGDLMITAQLARLLSSYEDSSIQKDLDDTKRKLLNNMHSIQCLTMDPGTVNTKMLLAGWGPCGINVKSANNTYKLAIDESYANGGVENGSYHFGGGGSRDAHDTKKLNAFWQKLSECTGYDYQDLSDCF